MSLIKNTAWTRILLLIIPYSIIVVIFQLIAFLIADIDYKDVNSVTIEQDVIISIFDFIGTFIVLWFFMKRVDKEPFLNLGLHLKNHKKDIIIGSLLGFIFFCFGYLLLIIINEIYYIETIFKLRDFLLSIVVFTIVALVEEVLFRGYILRNFMYSFNKYIALMLSSILFSLAHIGNPNIDWFSLLDLFLAGILLGISYIHTKNLWFPIGLHFGWNFFQSLFGFNVSGKDFYSLIEFEILENNILNGGDFGFEGSIFSTIFQVFMISSIFYYYHKKGINNHSIINKNDE